MPELESCPFCGREAQITDGGHSGICFWVRCISGRADNDFDCPASGGIVRKTKEEAIEAWNMRFKPDETRN